MMLESKDLNILQRWRSEQHFTSADIRQLLKLELASERAASFEVDLWNGEREIRRRAKLFGYSSDRIIEVARKLGFSSQEDILETLWLLWIPLALQLAQKRKNSPRPFIQGILGAQGTGKTTLTRMVCLLLGYLGYRAIALSIDDFYKTYAERCRLREKDPRLTRRGPPGTHDITLALNVLERLLQAKPKESIFLPRFDKSLHYGQGNRLLEPERVHDVDIVLFEGWFVGVRPVEKAVFNQTLPKEIAEVITLKYIQFARDSRRRLKEYLPLWEKLDSLMILSPQDYRWSITWRTEAEHQMIAQGKHGMDDTQIEEFVYYFWRSLHPQLYIKPLLEDPKSVDLVVEIAQDHRPCRIYTP